jgi:hypothetical protein
MAPCAKTRTPENDKSRAAAQTKKCGKQEPTTACKRCRQSDHDEDRKDSSWSSAKKYIFSSGGVYDDLSQVVDGE